MGANSDLARRWFKEVWCEHRIDAIDETMSADAYLYGTRPGEPMGREDFKRFHRLGSQVAIVRHALMGPRCA